MNFVLWVAGIVSFLIAITFHEYAHAFVADKLGDQTPRIYGRLTFNPLRHLDLLGIITFFLFNIGWAKPVPVNAANFKNPRRDMALVAVAGPTSNILLGIVGLLLRELGLQLGLSSLWAVALYGFVLINVLLALFNLFPIPPLDGYKFLKLILPERYDEYLTEYERYGPVLIVLLFWVLDFGRFLVSYTLKLVSLLHLIFVRPLIFFIKGQEH